MVEKDYDNPVGILYMYMILHLNQYQPNIGIYVIDIHQELYRVEDSVVVAVAPLPSFVVAVAPVVAVAAGGDGDIPPNLCIK